MSTRKNLKVIIVGSGNVATHLARAIAQSKHELRQVLSRDLSRAKVLVNNTNVQAIQSVSHIDPTADVVILALKDDVLNTEYINQFPKKIILCHTSGSVSMDALAAFPNHGIFYPLQTFSKLKEVDFAEIPICLEASNTEVMQTLSLLASSLSPLVYEVNSKQRKALHLAAVFACNFTNLMYDISEDLCQKAGMDFEILRPLIRETAAKVQEHSPNEVQTGPASRNDKNIINRHINLLNQHVDYQEIYRVLTDEIIKRNEEL